MSALQPTARLASPAHVRKDRLRQSMSAPPAADAPHIYILGAQGTTAAFPAPTVPDAANPLANALLTACYTTFLQELSSLSPEQLAGCALHSFQPRQSAADLLDVPSHLRSHPIFANVNLYVSQLLRFIAHTGVSDFASWSTQSPSSVFLAFSTGQLAASVISASTDNITLVDRAVEGLRVAFWLGYHVYRHSSGPPDVRAYNHVPPDCPAVYQDDSNVSEQPEAQAPPTYASHFAHTHTLYPSSALQFTKERVLADLRRRGVRFPDHENLHRPLRSTVDGSAIDTLHHRADSTLVEDILDMLLNHPVDIGKTVNGLCADLSQRGVDSVCLVNLGPRKAYYWQSTIRMLQDRGLSVDGIEPSSTPEPEATSILEPPPSQPTFVQQQGCQRPVSVSEVTSIQQPTSVPEQQSRMEPIAIVGMAVNFPGAPNAAELWKVLEGGINTVSEIPPHRFDIAESLHPADRSGRSVKSIHGNFLEDADVFDHAFFRVSPREARSMDPQQRVLLHVAHHALEDAGYVPDATPTFASETFAVYIGAATHDYVHNLRDEIDVYYSTGTLQAFLSGKISYAFGFGGPSVVVDTACSSAVVAIHQACRSLQAGDCNAALAGGVNVITSPDMHIGLDRAHFLSPTGQCRPWDASADGYCRAEGCGVFVLKRLSDALAEHDRILGVIRGTALNQSGTAASITHPHVATQAALFKRVLAIAGVRPAAVGVVEAHGTGTRAGDPAEIEALRAVFGGDGEREGVLRVMSVKANVGHAEAASGAASLAKLVLMMRHGTIPRTISVKTLNAAIAPLEKDGLCIDRDNRAWAAPARCGRRIALLNNFGAAGSHAALVLEEPPDSPVSLGERAFGTVVLGLSCDSLEALEELRERYIATLSDGPLDYRSLVDFAYTATARRRLYRYRLAVSGRSAEELCRDLRAAPVVRVGESARKVVFLFSGQGGQYRGMGAGLYEAVPAFRRAVDLCDEKLVSWGYQGVADMITGAPACDEGGVDELETSHCALFVLEYALAGMWRSWGLQPDVVIGHSLGEYAALVCADVVGLDDALRLVAQRARLTSERCPRGASGMLAVRADPNAVSELLKEGGEYEGLSIACHNSDVDCVVGGVLVQLELFQEVCHRSGYPCRRLEVDFAYHTESMGPILDELRSLSRNIQFAAPMVPMVSTVLGAVVSVGDVSSFTADHFARHCRDPVLFRQGVQTLFRHDGEARDAAWLEIGPHATTSPLLRGNGLSTTGMLLTSLRKGQADEESLCRALAQLYAAGVEVNWRAVFADLAPGAKITDIPSYPFAKTRFWVPYVERVLGGSSGSNWKPSSAFPGVNKVSEAIRWPAAHSGLPAVFELDIAQLSQFIDGHQVVGSPLCPASVYHELVLAASHAWCERIGLPPFASSLVLSDVVYEAPLVHSSRHGNTVSVEVSPKGAQGGFHAQFSVRSSGTRARGPWQTHCTGDVRAELLDSVREHLSSFRGKIQECVESLQIGAQNTRTMYASTIYEAFSKVVKYSDAFRTIKVITMRCDGADAYALAQAPAGDAGQYVVHPMFMDTLLHAAGFLLNLEADDDGYIFVCSHVRAVTVLPDFVRPSAMFGVYCQVGYLSQTMAIVDAYAIDLEGGAGQVFAHLGKIQFRRLSTTGFRAMLSMSNSDSLHLLSPAMSVRDPADTSEQQLSSQERILGIVADMCDIAVARITPESCLDHLGVDSLMSIELSSCLNGRYPGLNLTPGRLASLDRVGDLIELVGRCAPLQAAAELAAGKREQDGRAIDVLSWTEYVKSVLSAVLDIPTGKLTNDARLDCLGLDSLSSIEVRHTFSSAFHLHVPSQTVAQCSTIEELSIALADLTAVSGPPIDPPVDVRVKANPTLVQDGGRGTETPLILVHDGSGMVHPYMRLGDLDRAVWGIHNPKLSTGEDWQGGILEMATHYADLARSILGTGRSCMLGGWSFGGVVAFEMARILIASGVPVDGLLLIDSPHPQMGGQLPEVVVDAVVSAKIANPRHADLVRLQMRYASKALMHYDPGQSPAGHVVPPTAVMLRSQEGYVVELEDGETAEFLTHRRDPTKFVAGWERLLGATVSVLDIPGNHFQPFEQENVAVVTEKIREALIMLENTTRAIKTTTASC